MWERIRFTRYALRFERAFKTDDWKPVKDGEECRRWAALVGVTPHAGA